MSLYTIPTKECKNCGNQFTKSSSCSRKDWSIRQGCSPKCAAKLRDNSRLKQFNFKPGHSYGLATQFKNGQNEAELNNLWKGDSASYEAKHMWVSYHFGKPKECELCGTTEKRMYHWSNISGHYLRDREDWQRLCVPCHKAYDLAKLIPTSLRRRQQNA